MAVVGDGAFSSGIVLEALNHAGGLKKNLIVVLNDNKMSICPRVGGLAESLDRVRMNSLYAGIKSEVQKMLTRVPVIGDPVERFLLQVKDAVKAGLVGGMLFQDLGFHYHGPVDGHSIRQLQKYLAMAKQVKGPVLLHVVTEKGHGYDPAAEDPVLFHTPAPFSRNNGAIYFQEQRHAALYRGRPRHAAGRRWAAKARGWPSSRPPCARATCSSRSAINFPTASSTSASANRTRWPWPPAWPRPGSGPWWISTARSCNGATTRSSRRSRSRTCR